MNVFLKKNCVQLEEKRKNSDSDKKLRLYANEPDSSKCVDDTEPIVINIPYRLIERAQKYADEHGNTIPGVVIEALGALLGGRTTDGFR